MDQITRQDDYDSPWKQAIEAMFPEFMGFYFPHASAAIDWRQPHRFLEQELRKISPGAAGGHRVVDKLAQVVLRNGDRRWVYLHIEVQSSRDASFAERMFVYYYRIFDRFKHPVASFVLLADGHAGWRPSCYQQDVLGCRLRLEFPTVKTLDYQARETFLLESDNPFALVTLAHLHTRRTRGDAQQRYQAKFRLLRLLYGRAWSKDRIIQLLQVIDWLMALPPELDEALRQDMIEWEGAQAMQYVTSFERLARQEGRQEGMQTGRQEGSRAVLLRQLQRRFGPLPEEARTRLAKATTDELETWADRVLEAETLARVFR